MTAPVINDILAAAVLNRNAIAAMPSVVGAGAAVVASVVAATAIVTAIRSAIIALIRSVAAILLPAALGLLIAAAIVAIVTAVVMSAVPLAKGESAAGQSHRQDDGYHCFIVHAMLHWVGK